MSRDTSLQNAANKWYKQLKDGGFLDATPDNDMTVPKIILVGTQKDQPCPADVDTRADAVAQQIGAAKLIFTSAFEPLETGGVPTLFDEAVRAAMYRD
jgi:hypothetical protein